ncbi:MAG: hypothetical protein JWQ76_2440 [Ramlibacter sp.]|nr:hypothetical protein [Ramlibacter sp.]
MSTSSVQAEGGNRFELRFAGLFYTGRGYAFPCDAEGKVDVAFLSERALANYRRACASVGREFFTPVKCAVPYLG